MLPVQTPVGFDVAIERHHGYQSIVGADCELLDDLYDEIFDVGKGTHHRSCYVYDKR